MGRWSGTRTRMAAGLSGMTCALICVRHISQMVFAREISKLATLAAIGICVRSTLITPMEKDVCIWTELLPIIANRRVSRNTQHQAVWLARAQTLMPKLHICETYCKWQAVSDGSGPVIQSW